MAEPLGGKKYGLVIQSKTSKATSAIKSRPCVFGDDSDDEGKPKLAPLRRATGDAKLKKQTQLEIAKALADDPSVYEYDKVYDKLKEDEAAKFSKSKEKQQDKKPKYVQHLLKSAELRKKEQERRTEKKVQKEREAEGDEFKDKEAFVTSAYKKKLQEIKEAEEKEKMIEKMEAKLDVKNQKDMSGFHRHLLKQMTGEEPVPSIVKEEPQESEPSVKTEPKDENRTNQDKSSGEMREKEKTNIDRKGNKDTDMDRNKEGRYKDDKRTDRSEKHRDERQRDRDRGDRYHDRDDKYRDRDDKQKERDDKYRNKDDKHRERDDRYKDKDDKHMERDDRYRDKERDDKYRDRDDKHMERDDKYRDKDDKHKERDDRYRDRDEKHRGKDDRYRDRDTSIKDKDKERYRDDRQRDLKGNDRSGHRDRDDAIRDRNDRHRDHDDKYRDRDNTHLDKDDKKRDEGDKPQDKGDEVQRKKERGKDRDAEIKGRDHYWDEEKEADKHSDRIDVNRESEERKKSGGFYDKEKSVNKYKLGNGSRDDFETSMEISKDSNDRKRTFSEDRDDVSDEDVAVSMSREGKQVEKKPELPKQKYAKRNTEQTISDAKSRYLARKQAKAALDYDSN